MRAIPLSVYLDWPAPNYEDPTTRGDALLTINIVFIILVTLSIGVRLYSRMLVKHQSGIDDVMIVLAYIFTIGMTAVVLLANRNYGWNRHMWDVELDMIEHANIIAFVAKIMFTLASSFTRLSLIFLYYRLVRDTQFRWYAWTLHINLAFNICLLISFILMVVFTCIPVQAYWQFPNMLDGRCLDEGKMTLACGIVSCIADLLCTVLPIPVVLRLRMPLRQRIGICVLLSAGIIVTIAGVIRTYFIWKSLIDTFDETWFTYPLWICAALEIDIAVICACVPAMKTVLWKPFRRWTGTWYSHWTSSYRGTKSRNVRTTSQDPIVHGSVTGNNGYALDNMDIEKAAYYGRKPDANVLERAIAQLPGANHERHPHHTPCNGKKDSANASSGEHKQQLPQTVYNPLSSGINKETTFQVSHTHEAPRSQSRTRARAPSAAGQRNPRPRYQPLIPLHQDNVTPRTLDEIYSSRVNGSAGLAPTSPAPDTVSRNNTAPLSPMSPSSMYSTDIDSVQSPPPQRSNKRHGGTFFFG